VKYQLKKGRVLLALSVVFIITSYLPTNRFLPEWSSSTGSYDLGPGNVNGPTVYLLYNGIVESDVSISGANQDVYFYITDSSGRRVLDVGRIYDGYHLEWRAPGIDSYRLDFDNTMSLVSHKYVNWSFQVFHYNTLFFFLGIILLVIGTLQIIREEEIVQRVKGILFKEPESQVVECQYCGTIYAKTLDKCPRCGATKKVKDRRGENKSL